LKKRQEYETFSMYPTDWQTPKHINKIASINMEPSRSNTKINKAAWSVSQHTLKQATPFSKK
jgi:hypothetical protein